MIKKAFTIFGLVILLSLSVTCFTIGVKLISNATDIAIEKAKVEIADEKN